MNSPKRTGLIEGSFFVGGCQFDPPFHIYRMNNLISIQIYTIFKQSIWSSLKLKKKCWHLLYADAISFSVTGKCQKLRNIDENS